MTGMKRPDNLKHSAFDPERDDMRRGNYQFACAGDATGATAIQIRIGGEIVDPVDDLLDDPAGRLRIFWG